MAEADRVSALEIRVVEDKVVLVLELADERPPAVAVMSPREAHSLRSRLHKAANDASAAAQRRKATA
jgi:hypothetical protein